MKRWIKRLSITLIIALGITFGLDKLVQFRESNEDIYEYFSTKNLKPKIGHFKAEGRDIRYISIGEDTSATILFIHGAPSSLSYYKDYLSDSTLLHRAHMYAVDRPGYGYSGFGDPLTSIEKQAKIMATILDSLRRPNHPVVVVGTSYGTSVASRLTMDYPNLVDGLVLVGPSLAPGEEKIYDISYPMEIPPLKWMVPRTLVSANAEKLSHYQELKKMLPLWSNIKIPVAYIQGADDDLIYTSNAKFARKKLINVPSLDITLIANRGHLITFTEKEFIQKTIVKMLDKVQQKPWDLAKN
ncbi:alpha/beta hydrolase [Xanthocytophaga agilis]|uniref:Alpha/beta hydrolase n=1 Tax=Xanthocytophaga agilis TaxID=3048010 RepID=A0AAE3UEW4_9BACT|nr:alpha/beta hydrolase [Xanthocytophaga agilis]MDJ1501766.1 alpha/beta hydrolase [Xanthocytophaga agilis]